MKRLNRAACLFLFSLLFLLPHLASASTSQNLSGWAWSDGIGWISFNCTNDNSCATADYGVNENADGTLVGYAWSSNVGWIQFGGLSSFPTGTGTQSINAQVTGSTLVGWAKAISADGNGWDGWISLSGTSPSYGVTISGANFTGYAWGGSVVGWLSFDAANSVVGTCGVADCTGVALAASATLDAQSGGTSIANNSNVAYGTVASLVWTVGNLSGATCSISKTSSGGTAFATVSNITTSGSTSTQGLTTGAYTFNIACTSAGNTIASANVSFTVAAQPPGFSIGSNDTIAMAFLPSGWTQSPTKTVSVYPVGGFTGNVTFNITGFPTMPNATTTALYSFDGGATYYSSPSVTIPYTGSFSFRVKVLAPPLTAAYCAGGTNPCTITLTGSSAGFTSATKTFTIVPTAFNPQFQEQ